MYSMPEHVVPSNRDTFPNTGGKMPHVPQHSIAALSSKPKKDVVANIFEKAVKEVASDKRTEKQRSETISKCLQSGPHNIFAGVATIVSLLAYDFTIAYLPPETDMSTLIVIAAVFTFFTIEVILTAIAERKYILTFFCLLDIVGALSLIPDMLQLIEGMGLLDYGSSASDIGNAGKVGRVARATGTVKLAKFARLFRVVRLVRVIRLFRMSMTDGVHHKDNTPSRPSNVGKLLATKVTQRIVALIIAMILVLPYLEVAPSKMNMSTTLQYIERIKPVGSLEFNTSVNTLLNEMIETGEPFVYLRVAGRIIVELPEEEMELYRTTEIISHCVPRCDGVRTLEQYYSSAQNTVKRPNSIQAQLSMLMCFFVIIVFVLSSHAVSNDARNLVIKPIERMTKIVHKLASTVCMLSNENEQNSQNGQNGHGDNNKYGNNNSKKKNYISNNDQNNDNSSLLTQNSMETLNEAELLEEVMTQMTHALKAKQKRGNSGRSSSGLSNMMGRRSSLGGVVSSAFSRRNSNSRSDSSDRKWKSRFSFSGSAQLYATGGHPNGSRGENTKSSNLTRMSFSQLPIEVRDAVKQHRDLISISTILHSRLASKYLRQHMARTLTLENYMFWDEVEKLKAMQIALRQRIFERFILQSSPNQVNLDCGTRGRIEMYMLESSGVTTPFDDAQKMVENLMQLNTYIPFLTSDKCRQYVQEDTLHQKRIVGPYVHVTGIGDNSEEVSTTIINVNNQRGA